MNYSYIRTREPRDLTLEQRGSIDADLFRQLGTAYVLQSVSVEASLNGTFNTSYRFVPIHQPCCHDYDEVRFG